MRRRWLRRSEEGLDFISRRVQANSELPSTAFALNNPPFSPPPPPRLGGGRGEGRGGEERGLHSNIASAQDRGGQFTLPFLNECQKLTSVT